MLQDMMTYFQLARKAKSIWEDLGGQDRERVDALVREAVTVARLPASLEPVRSFLATGSDPLPMRLVGAFLHPATRQVMNNVTIAGDVEAVANEVLQDAELTKLLS